MKSGRRRRLSLNVASSLASKNQHAVAIAVETVALSDGVLIGAKDQFAVGKSAHQHQQCGAGEMKVGQERLNHLESKARHNKEAGFAARSDDFSGVHAGDVLKRPNAGGADRDDATALVAGALDGKGGLG